MISFEEYVRTRGPALVRVARLIAGDPVRGEDLAQETLARAYLKWKRIASADNPDGYLRQMLVNANRSWWRLRSSHERPVESLPEEPVVAVADDRGELWELIRALPRRQREVLVLRYYEDLDDHTIAVILDCSPVTVRTHAMRAVHALRDRLTENEGSLS